MANENIRYRVVPSVPVAAAAFTVGELVSLERSHYPLYFFWRIRVRTAACGSSSVEDFHATSATRRGSGGGKRHSDIMYYSV